MKWIIRLLDYRLWNGAGQGGGGGAGQGGGGGDAGAGASAGDAAGSGAQQGGGGQGYAGPVDWGTLNPSPTPPPVAAPPPPPPQPGEPGWEWAANRQVSNIDRSSQFSHEQYVSALEGIHQQSQASGAGMGPGAYDYELPDQAFGTTIY